MAGELLTTTNAEQTAPAHTPRYKRLTSDDLAILHTMLKAGKTQVEVAETLGCDQSVVSRWAKTLIDTTDVASTYLRGSALRMAKNVVNKGQARDHIQALKGIGVLEQDQTQLNIAVGVSLPGLSLSPPVSVERGEGVENP
jgi:hypothetical protein